MKISEFNEIIGGDDFARNNMYSIEIYMPRGHKTMGTSGGGGYLGKFYTGADLEKGGAKFLSYKAKQVSIPGKTLGTIDAKRFGPIFKVANDLIVDTTTMTFMCGEDYAEHRFFDGWISAIIGQVKHGTGVSAKSPKPTHRQVYTLSYYLDYVGEVRIIPLDRQGGSIANVVLIEAYPSNVGPIEYIWGEAGEIATFTVTWMYRDWNHTDPENGWWADSSQLAQGSVLESAKKKEKPPAIVANEAT
jgi:hypothetical protein